MIFKPFKFLLMGLLLLGILSVKNVYSHGLIESPASREYFCGKITRPEHTESGELPYEQCRPILKKEGKYNNDIYQFMAVLSHSRGYYQSTHLPANVCGFDSEAFLGRATPWDAAIDWPMNPIVAGSKEFVWDISYGPHFSDTEHFRYWITRPDYQFEVGKPLQWTDLEQEPFCELPWDDQQPNKNPDIWADKPNNKFHMKCTVPPREGRHVIYAEWGRTAPTNERFHACVDVNYSAQQENQVKAKIAPLAVKEFYGEGIIELNGTESIGEGLTYQWAVESKNPSLYTLQDAKQPVTTLFLKNPMAEENISVVLHVSNSAGSSHAEVKIQHEPARSSEWRDLGKLTNGARVLQAGDEVQVRVVQKDGKDIYYPAEPLTITAEVGAADTWPYVLGQAVDQLDVPIKLGVLSSGEEIPQPVKQATDNRIYAKENSNVQSAYLQVKTIDPQPSSKCRVTLQAGNSPYWAGLDIATDSSQVRLDFSGTGLDLTKVKLDPGVFQAVIEGQSIIITQKPAWVNATQPGYLGLNGNDPALANFVLPTCDAN